MKNAEKIDGLVAVTKVFSLVLHWLVSLRFKTLSTFAVTFESVTYIHFAVPFFMSITFRVPFLFLFPLELECAFFNLVASTLKINFRLKLDKSNLKKKLTGNCIAGVAQLWFPLQDISPRSCQKPG